jgi:tRNA-specific 2-thiouridylase
VELVTIGQRKGLGLGGGTRDPRFAVAVDARAARVTIGTRQDLLATQVRLDRPTWASGSAPHGAVLAQVSAHGAARPGHFAGDVLTWAEPQRRVAPGQSVVLYAGDEVLGGGPALPDM